MSALRVDRRTRLKMLLTSYEDALAGLDENGLEVSGAPESRLLLEKFLWKAGSYAELEQALKKLTRTHFKALYVAYIAQSPRRPIEERVRLWETPLATDALRALDLAMPRKIRVPNVIRGNWDDYVAGGPKKRRDRKGWVYFIRAGTVGPVKIGSSDNPWARLGALQTSNANTLNLLAIYPGLSNESDLHKRFDKYRIRGEWFEFSDEIERFIEGNCYDPNEYPYRTFAEVRSE